MRTIQRAFREAPLASPADEYDWSDIQARPQRSLTGNGPDGGANMTSSAGDEPVSGASEPELGEERQRKSFEFAGPLFSVTISPASTIVRVAERRELRALLRDRSRRRVETDLEFHWQVIEGPGRLDGAHDQAVTFRARMGWDSRGSR